MDPELVSGWCNFMCFRNFHLKGVSDAPPRSPVFRGARSPVPPEAYDRSLVGVRGQYLVPTLSRAGSRWTDEEVLHVVQVLLVYFLSRRPLGA